MNTFANRTAGQSGTILSVLAVVLVVTACVGPAVDPTGRGGGAPLVSEPEVEQPLTATALPPAATQTPTNTAAANPTPTPLVPLSEIISGGPPPDGIPPIDEPKYVAISGADEWLAGREPVIAVEINGVARAFPLQIMTWHEIVNTEFGDKPVTVTYCPLCNTALVFDRELNGTVYDFGTSGRLYNSALVMYDRQTGSWWSQVLGRAIVGELTGTQLEFLPAAIVSWADFKTTYPNGLVLSRETGHQRSYGANPYARYDRPGNRPFLFRGEIDQRLDAMERVVGVELNGEAVAYPFGLLEEARVVADSVSGEDVVVFYYPGTASALDSNRIAEARDVGAAAIFHPVTQEGRELTFTADDDGDIVDEETGSTWNILGQATSGELEGHILEPVVHGNHFWFAWAAFNPETEVYTE
jgi:hypothetical protein